MLKFSRYFFLFVGLWLPAQILQADYGQEIRNHIRLIENRYSRQMDLVYFKDMGVVARKADEANEDELASEIIGMLLMRKMDAFILSEIGEAETLFEENRYDAVKIIQNLNRFEKFYRPTDEYKQTASGQAFSGELIRLRQNALDGFKQECSVESLIEGLQALRKTGLFLTNTPEEITNLREITNELNCCLAWKPKLHFYDEIPFETDYDSGTIVEEARLKLKSSPRLYADASWTGEWIYKFEGRDGVGEGVSKAVLKFQRGDDLAFLNIGASRLRSSGRINFPIMLAGEARQLDVGGSPLFPFAHFSEAVKLPLRGCHES